MSTEINIKKRITALDESVILTKDLSTINFVGAGVVASSIGEDVTVTIPGGSGSGVTSVTGLDTDNTDPANPIINISVDGVTITGSGTPMDPLVSVDAVSGSGALNFVSKWTGIDSLGNSQIRDNGSKIAVNGSILSAYKFAVYSTTLGENYNIYGNTTVNGAVGVAGVNQGVGASTNYGALGEAQNSTSLNIGVYGQAIGASTENVGGKFSATLATSNYAVQLQDGTEGVGKVLTSMTADGKAQWATATGAPAWLESNATDLTIWNNGKGNIATNSSYGDEALKLNTTGSFNTAIGYRTLTSNTTGIKNVALGNNALFTNDSGLSNVAIGYNTMYFNISGIENLGIGDSSLVFNTTANYNTALGVTALRNNTTGTNNTGVGNKSSYSMTTGSNNTSLGSSALYTNTTSSDLTAIGFSALYSNTSGTGNTAIGTNALKNNTLGSDNIAIGNNALYTNNTNGDQNIAIGTSALYNNEGFYNVGIGYAALYSNTLGENNTAIGHSALLFNTTAFYNTAIGFYSLKSNTTGENNTGVGMYSLRVNTTGGFNTAVGRSALVANTTGSDNTAIGYVTNSANFSGSVILGRAATATASNQFVVGSVTVNAGAVTAEVNASTQVWNVIINGVARKILLA